MSIVALVLGGAFAFDVIHAFVRPYKVHQFCRGKGLDPYCGYSGKVLRFGAQWVRPDLRRK